VSPNDDPHDFKVQYEEPDNLPWEKLSPKPGCTSGSWWESNFFRAGNDLFFLHFLLFWDEYFCLNKTAELS
jgi:hypothetical protein